MTEKPIPTFSPLQTSLFSILLCFNLCICFSPTGRAQTQGMFVFGSSLVDNGNNNFVENSTARADYLPYGIDFPSGPSGRFSNGKNMIDALGLLLQLPHFVPAFSDPETKGIRIIHGVNYASGGSGILDETGSVSGRVINLNQQIRNFEEVTTPELCFQGRCNNTHSLSNYLFIVGVGGNDYLLNYFLPNNTNKPTLQAFTANLIDNLSGQIKKLYSLGARKFMLISLYPLGCTPFVKKSFSVTNGCLDTLNQVARLFNSQLKSLVDVINPQIPGSNLVYINSYQIIMDIIAEPISKGFTDTSNACCDVISLSEGGNGILCKRSGYSCQDRTGHVFFDGLHTTEAVNVLIANKAYSSCLPTEAYPLNVQQLAKI